MTDEKLICPVCEKDLTDAARVLGHRGDVIALHTNVHLNNAVWVMRDAVMRGTLAEAQDAEKDLSNIEHALAGWK